MPINCGAIPAELLESELFGHTKGAYTGAVAATEGLIREAHGGTLFLDEISELAPQLQVKLLRVIQEKQVRPLGSPRVFHTDVRFLAASNRDLKSATAQGAFRADLFYRLNVININVPPLRERGKDIELLAQHFVAVHSRRLSKDITNLGDDVKDLLSRYRWPGNVRELENVIERAVILADGPTLTARDFSDLSALDPTAAAGCRERRRRAPHCRSKTISPNSSGATRTATANRNSRRCWESGVKRCGCAATGGDCSAPAAGLRAAQVRAHALSRAARLRGWIARGSRRCLRNSRRFVWKPRLAQA